MASAKGKTTSATTNAGTPQAINVFTVNKDKSPATWPVPAGRLGTQPGRLGNAATAVDLCGFVACRGRVGGAKALLVCASAARRRTLIMSLLTVRATCVVCGSAPRRFEFVAVS